MVGRKEGEGKQALGQMPYQPQAGAQSCGPTQLLQTGEGMGGGPRRPTGKRGQAPGELSENLGQATLPHGPDLSSLSHFVLMHKQSRKSPHRSSPRIWPLPHVHAGRGGTSQE